MLLAGLSGLVSAAPLKKEVATSGDDASTASVDIDQAMSRVVHGEAVKSAADWQFVVDLSQAKDFVSKTRFCTGTLIRDNVVLTAAHCVLNNGDMGDGTFATAGRINLQDEHSDNSGSETLRAVAAVAHPEYTGLGSPKDVALLLLESSAKKNVVKLADATPDEGTETTVVGYGLSVLGTVEATHNRVEVLPSKLQMTKLRIEKRDFCDESRPGMSAPMTQEGQSSPVTAEGMLCTSGVKHGSSACRGDSGGGLFALRKKGGKKEAVQVGIVSYGDAQCMSEDSGIFTDVASVRDWIDHTADRLNDIRRGNAKKKSEKKTGGKKGDGKKGDKKKEGSKEKATQAPSTTSTGSPTTTSTEAATVTDATETAGTEATETAATETTTTKAETKDDDDEEGDIGAVASRASIGDSKKVQKITSDEGIVPIGLGEIASVKTTSKAPYTNGRYLSFVRVAGGAGRRVEAFACVEEGSSKPRMFLVGDESARHVKEEVGKPGKDGCSKHEQMVRSLSDLPILLL